MTQIDLDISKGQLIPLVFMQSDVAVSQTNAQLTVAEVRDVAAVVDDQNAADGYSMPFAGEVIGISLRSSAARTAGTATVEGMVGTVATGLTAVLDAANTQNKATTQIRGSDRFVAGDVVRARITTDASWAPVTADFAVIVWVLLYLQEGAAI